MSPRTMPLRPSIFELIRQIADDSVDQAMAAALPTADPADQRLIVDALLQRGEPLGTVGLVLHYHRLPADSQQTVADRVADLYRPMREAAAMRQTEGPSNVVEIVRRSRSTRLAYLVGDQLVHGAQDLRRAAGQCLLELARWCAPSLGDGSPRAGSGQTTKYLLTALSEAVGAYDAHRQPDVLLALAAMAPQSFDIAANQLRQLSPGRTGALDDMRVMLHKAAAPEVCRSLLTLLRHPELGGDVVTALRRAVGTGQLAKVLEAGHLLHHPQTRRLMADIKDAPSLLPTDATLADLPAEPSRAAPWWISALPLAAHEHVEQLAPLADLPDRMARLAVLRQLIRLSDDGRAFGAFDVIAKLCLDADTIIARLALRHLIRRNWQQLPQIMLRLVNSPDEQLRAMATTWIGPMGFERLWHAWPRLTGAQQLHAGKALIKIDPNFHQHLTQHLTAPTPGSGPTPGPGPVSGPRRASAPGAFAATGTGRADRLRALAIIHALNQGHVFERALIELCDDGDEMIVASAVRALGTVDSPPAVRALESALDHTDSRVRANAVEALQQLRATQHVGQLADMARHEDNRPRANAINALLQMSTSDALAALIAMLKDDRPEHRTSALWLIEAAGLVELVTAVAELSISDPTQDVRQRADNVVHQLIHTMRDPLPSQAGRDVVPA